MSLPWTARTQGVAVSVRLTPKSSRDEISGIEHLSDGRAVLKVRVRAVPENGAANEALLRLLANFLSVAPRSVHLESGGTSRLKVLHVAGDPAAITERLAALRSQA